MNIRESIGLKTRTGFSAVPNKIAQDKSLSLQALGLVTYLQSLPDGWRIYPGHIQREKRISRDNWQKLAKELRNHGYLKLHAGGKEAGSFYEFDIWNCKEKQGNPESGGGSFSLAPRTGYIGAQYERQPEIAVAYKETLSNKTKTLNNNKEVVDKFVFEKTTNNDKSQDRCVASEIIQQLSNYGINMNVAYHLISGYGIEVVRNKLNLLKETISRGTPIHNASGWIKRCLEQNWPGSQKPQFPVLNAEETQAMLESKEPTNLPPPEKRKEYMQQIQQMLSHVRVNV